MQSPFEAIKEVDGEGREWWNSRKLARLNETFWLSQRRMAELFNVTIQDINYHLIQIGESGEVHLSDAIKKNLIPSDKWDEQGVYAESRIGLYFPTLISLL